MYRILFTYYLGGLFLSYDEEHLNWIFADYSFRKLVQFGENSGFLDPEEFFTAEEMMEYAVLLDIEKENSVKEYFYV